MAPAASIHSATAAATGASKRPAASDAEHPLDDSALHQQGDEAVRKGQQPREQLECPRCHSSNTKFCYYKQLQHGAAAALLPRVSPLLDARRHTARRPRRSSGGGGGGGKRRRVSAESSSASASPPQPPPMAAASLADACLPDLTSAFPFLSDGSFFPQFDVGSGVALAPAAFSSSWQSVVPDFYDGLAPWDDGGTAGFAGAWGDIGGLDLSWTPPGN